MTRGNYILWLPSWYPNDRDPFIGDFIQRHALAASMFGPITVIHFTQFGESIPEANTYEVITVTHKLKEVVSYMAFKPKGNHLLDKIRYNLMFYQHAKTYLVSYFEKFGLPQMVHVHVPIKAGNLARWIKSKYGIDYVVTEHSSFYLKDAPNSFFDRSFLFRLQTKKVFQLAQKVTSVSEVVNRELSQLFPIKKLDVIHNVVDTNFFNYSAPKNSKFTFIHVSNFSIEKNFSSILSNFKRLSTIRDDWRALVVGPPKDEDRAFVANNQLDKFVEFIGEVQYTEVAEWMKKAHALILFSLNENFPCVIIEALCCGLPVISSDVGGIREAIDKRNGILVPRNDENELLIALEGMINNYKSYNTEEIAAEARGKYAYSAIGRQIFNLYSINSLS